MHGREEGKLISASETLRNKGNLLKSENYETWSGGRWMWR